MDKTGIDEWLTEKIATTLDGTSNTHFGYIFGASSYSNTGYVPTSLKEVIITGGSSIGYAAFDNCSSLQTVYYTGRKQKWNKISIDSFDDEYELIDKIEDHTIEF